mmetsp:Transcript_8623/g.16502  ORF Transcript_8623/g.16502 Transcript_8623/m.16502 type:complete len:200 (+) Transcript_8623:419-1018(+)
MLPRPSSYSWPAPSVPSVDCKVGNDGKGGKEDEGAGCAVEAAASDEGSGGCEDGDDDNDDDNKDAGGADVTSVGCGGNGDAVNEELVSSGVPSGGVGATAVDNVGGKAVVGWLGSEGRVDIGATETLVSARDCWVELTLVDVWLSSGWCVWGAAGAAVAIELVLVGWGGCDSCFSRPGSSTSCFTCSTSSSSAIAWTAT